MKEAVFLKRAIEALGRGHASDAKRILAQGQSETYGDSKLYKYC